MNKKGVVIHFVLLGLLIALGTAILYLGDWGLEPKGQWQLDFLKNNYLEAEKELFKNDIIIKQIGLEAAKELAANGGYISGTESSCGKFESVQIWFKEGEWCFPGIKDAMTILVKSKLNQRMPNNRYSEVDFNGPFLTGKGEKGVVSRELATYTFDTSFSVYLGYSFEEYQKLQEEGLRLVASCRGKENLEECLDNAKQNYWKYGSCESEEFPDSKIVPFCVSSPGLYYINDELVTYGAAFDFS